MSITEQLLVAIDFHGIFLFTSILEHHIRILEWFLKDHVKTKVMAAENSALSLQEQITFFLHIEIENCYYKL